MTTGPSSNRLRHVARRVREVPLSFLIDKSRLLVRRYTWWPRCVLGRLRPSPAGAPPLNHAFLEMGTDLRRAVAAAVGTDHEYRRDLVARVHWVLDNRQLPCLGYGWLPVPSGAQWRTDSTTGFEWPLEYFPFVNFLTHGQPADVKVPWELSRLQWLVWLGEAATAHPEAEQRIRAGTALAEILEEWRRSNPLGYGPNWTVSMEVAIRALNIGLAASLGWETLPPASRELVRTVLHEHLEYLRRFPELSDHKGNHYLVNVCGLVFLEELVFGPTRDGAARRQRWLGDLAEQFEADGLHVEHAPLYHRLCVETVLWTAASMTRSGSVMPAGFEALVARCSGALRTLEMTSGDLPVIGDADSGQLVSFGPATRNLRYLRQLLGFAAGGPPLLAAVAGTPIAGAESLATAASRGGASAPQTQRVGPFVRVSGHDVDVTLRAGPHGLFGRASHDHDDNGALWVTLGSRDVLVEAGCYAYTRSAAERLRDLSSESHNVVTIANHLRFVPEPGSMSPTVARAPIAALDTGSAAGDGTIDLSLSWADPAAGTVRHARRITLGSGGAAALLVDDELALERRAPVTVRWHFAPQWSVELDGPSTAMARTTDGAVVRAHIGGADGAPPVVLRVGEYRYSGRYGEAEAARVLEATAPSSPTVRFRSAFRKDAAGS